MSRIIKPHRIAIITLLIMLTLSVFSSYGQITVKGKVFDIEKNILCGVTIREKGTDNFTFSDIEGDFNLQVTDSNSIIEFSYIGFKTKEVTVRETRHFLIILKEDCFIDFFDERIICLGLSSDPVNSPSGVFFQMTHPFIRGALIGKINYQSDFSDNYEFDIKTGIIHLIVNCDYNADLDFNYRDIKIVDKFQFKNYTVESKMNFSRPKIFPNYTTLYLGFGLSDIKKTDFSQTNQAGYMLGIGTGTGIGRYPHHVSLEIGVKSVYWTNFWEWKGEIIGKINERIYVSAEFDMIDSSFTMGFKIGYRFGYRRISVR